MAGYTNVQVLDRVEAKIEGTRGTAETTMTKAIIYPLGGASFSYEQSLDGVDETLRGYHTMQDQQLGISMCKLNIEFLATYEELAWWLNLALKGSNLTGSVTGTTGYAYTFTPTPGSDDLATATFKVGDGATCYKLDRGVVNTLTLRWNPMQGGDTVWRCAAEILCRFQGTSTFDSPSSIARTKVLARGTAVTLDDSSLSATATAGLIRSGSVTINNNIEEKQFTEDSSLMSADFARGPQVVTCELVHEFKADTEWAKYRAGTIRKLRIKQIGPAIAGGTAYNTLQIDLPTAKALPSLSPSWAGQNRINTFQYVGERTNSTVNPISVEVTNSNSTTTA